MKDWKEEPLVIPNELEFDKDFKKNLKEIWRRSKILNCDGQSLYDDRSPNHTIGYATDEFSGGDGETLIDVTRNFKVFLKDVLEFMKTHDELFISIYAEYMENGDLREDNSGKTIRIFRTKKIK